MKNIEGEDCVASIRTVYGWGINDVDYRVYRTEVVQGRHQIVWTCPYYLKWKSMVQRCFCPKYQEKHPTYKGCTICDEWRYLSNFIRWVDSQPNRDWQSCQLDKDFISVSDKFYSQSTAVFVSKEVNNFIKDCYKSRGGSMIGVCFYPRRKKNPYKAQCCSPFGGKREYIGMFPTEIGAHLAWKAKKHEYACVLADLQEDGRVAKALRERYAPDKDWTNA